MLRTLLIIVAALLSALWLLKRRQTTADTKRIVLAVSIAGLTLLTVLLAQFFPVLIVGKHGSSLHVFKALSQVEADVVFMFVRNREEWGHFNWDEPWLLIDGYCGSCGKPYAPKGTFIVSLLPKGLAITRRAAGKYDHMTTPRYLSRWVILGVGVGMAVVIAFNPIHRRMRRRRWKRRGLCLDCGYDLTGNESGRCSECGTACQIESGVK